MDNFQELALKMYEEHYTDLMRLALTILKNEHAAEEVVQELCVKILERKELFEKVASEKLKSYYSTTIYRACLNRRKADKRLTSLDPEISGVILLADDPELQGIEHSDEIRELLEEWPPEVREAFVQHVLTGLPLKEIAKSMGILPNTLIQRINRWRKKLDTSLLLFILLHMLYD